MTGLEVSMGEVLLEKGWSLAVAESCTGGLLGARITSVPGSSGYFKGGVIAYSNQLKEDLLGVPADLIERAGAVSSEAALAMASGLKRLGVQVGVAITGVAGPDGGTPGRHPRARRYRRHTPPAALPGRQGGRARVAQRHAPGGKRPRGAG